MKIGVPKEIKKHEYRVGLTPSHAAEYISSGHTVYIQSGAGTGSGFIDGDYIAAGCEIIGTAEEIYGLADMIIKVKEPLEPEYKLIRPGQILFTYFHLYCGRVKTLYSTDAEIARQAAQADIVIGAALIPGAATPKLLKRAHLKNMKPGAVVVDVAIDQGGAFESSHVTYHDAPVYLEEGILHYCVGNMPGAVPYTSTVALNNATLKYGLQIACKGYRKALSDNPGLAAGLNAYMGTLTCAPVGEVFGIPVKAPNSVFV